ncbi:MAG: hypothetical protein EOL95_10425 [Bacteroidia bacterium]|nr:hypothetical protein [Bacteroidia bacterium]
METSKIDKYQDFKRNSLIAVRPYVDNNTVNMGLEKYNMALFDGVYHEEPIVCLEVNGVKRYITGLNEFAPDVKNLPEEEREAKVKYIRKIVAQIERELFGNVVKEDDEHFWDKIKGAHPTNYVFWEKVNIRCSNEPVYLDPNNDIYDLIRLIAIEAGGFTTIAKSLEDARTRAKKVKFYLDKYEETASTEVSISKLRNKAGAMLQSLYDSNRDKLMLVCKNIDVNSAQYKKSTPIDIMYRNLDDYIEGKTVERNKKKTAKTFIEVAELDMETLKLKALLKDGTYYGLIATKADGHIYHMTSNTLLGRNPSDVVAYLRDPLNEDVLKELIVRIEKYWNE